MQAFTFRLISLEERWIQTAALYWRWVLGNWQTLSTKAHQLDHTWGANFVDGMISSALREDKQYHIKYLWKIKALGLDFLNLFIKKKVLFLHRKDTEEGK